MCSGGKGARAGLLGFSLLLMVVALTCVAGGVVFILGKSVYGEALDDLKDELSVSAAAIVGGNTLDVSGLDIEFITFPLGITLLVSGFLTAIVCILGIIAACGQFYKFIIVYEVLLACLYFSQIVVIICAYTDKESFNNLVKNHLKDSLDKYNGIDGNDSYTLGWNAIMSKFKCCGVDSYQDFTQAGGFPKSISGYGLITTPQICCITKSDAPFCANDTLYTSMTFFNRGCYSHVWEEVTTNSVLIICIVYAVILFEFLCLFFAMWIICHRMSLGESKVAHYDKYDDGMGQDYDADSQVSQF